MAKHIPFSFLNERMYRLWVSRLGHEPICVTCGEKITSEDTVKPRRVGGKYSTHTVHYHSKCYEKQWETVSVKEDNPNLNLVLLDLFDRIHALERRVKK